MHVWNRFGAIARRCAYVALLCPPLLVSAGELPQRHKPEHPFPHTVPASPHLAPGFTSVNVAPGSHFNYPTAFAIAPDGFMLVAEKGGAVFAVENGTKDPMPFIDLRAELLSNGDRGLMGLALDPNFLSNGFVYFGYEVDPDSDSVDDNPSTFGRIVRYTTMTGDRHHVDPSTRTILLGHDWSDGIANPYLCHTIDALRFGTDGTLLVSAGDGGHFEYADIGGNDSEAFTAGKLPSFENIGALRAQSINSLSGKILRIDPATGEGMSSNPWFTGDPLDKASKVWCMGLRNPFRFTVKPGTGSADPIEGDPGEVYIPDCGWYSWEEVNLSRRGGENFGWPCREGFLQNSPYASACDTFTTERPTFTADPIYDWNHTNASISIPPGYTGWCAIGGVFYTGSAYPASYQGTLFVADYQDWIRVAHISPQGTIQYVEPFADGLGEPVDMAINPVDGDLYYLSLLAGEVRHIQYNAPQVLPVAHISGGPVMGPAPVALQLTAAGSTDGGEGPLTYEWSVRDGVQDQIFSPNIAPMKTVTDEGKFLISVRVANSAGQSDTSQLYVVASPDAPVSYDITSHGTPVASRSLIVLGRASIAVVADNKFPPPGSHSDIAQFTTADGGDILPNDWIGYTFPSSVKFTGVVFESGLISPDGGAMRNVRVQVRSGGDWQDISGWTATPIFDPSGYETSFNIHLIRFDEIPGDGIRVIGQPQGDSRSISCAEMRVFAKTQFPIAHATAIPANGRVRLPVQFSSSASSDPAGLSLTTVWEFGDGVSSTDREPQHTYVSSGTYIARLLVTNESGNSSQDSVSIHVLPNTKPRIAVLSPADSSLHRIGEEMQFNATGTDVDAADSDLQYTWQVNLHHNLHVHPAYFTSNARQCVLTMGGHGDNDSISYEVIATATDAGSLTDSARLWLFPNHSPTLSLDSSSLNPSGGYAYHFSILGHDPDLRSGLEDSLRLEALHKPDWMSVVAAGSGADSWILFGTPPPGNQPDSTIVLRIIDRLGAADTISFPLHQVYLTNMVSTGWNLLSLSRIPVESGLTQLFPSAVSRGFAFESQQYAAVDTLKPGKGYWIKFASQDVFAVGGVPFEIDSLQLERGWNMVGVPDGESPVANISTVPPNSITSHFFGFDGGYIEADTLHAGQGYWVKVNVPCLMTIVSSSTQPAATVKRH